MAQCQTGLEIQTVIFDKASWDADRARKWLKDHNLRADKVDETEDSLRFRQQDPGRYVDGSFRTQDVEGTTGIKYVFGCPRAKVAAKIDLDAEIAFWQKWLRLRDWQITGIWKEGLTDPNTGAAAEGLCKTDTMRREALIMIDPNGPELIPTIAHEVVHVKLPEEDSESTVEDLAQALAGLRVSDPIHFAALAKSAARQSKKVFARVRACIGGMMYDPKQLEAAIAALETKDGDKALEILKAMLLAAATGGAASGEPGMGEPPTPAKDAAAPGEPAKPPADPMPPEKKDEPKMGMEDQRYKALAKAQADDRAAAVDGLLDTRPDLSTKQRARLRELGVAGGVQRLREDLADLAPAPKQQAANDTRPRMGVDKPPTGGKGKAFRPSGNESSMIRLRLSAEENAELTAPGAVLHDAKELEDTGRLFEISIWRGLPAIRKAVAASTHERAKRLHLAGGDS